MADKGRRLVYTQGIVILAVLSGLLLVVFGGITDRLIPLFAVGAFLAFTLSQAGMVIHWRREGGRHARWSLVVNAIGALATGVALAVVLVAKFREGAWVTVLLIPAMFLLFTRVKRHYEHAREEVRCTEPLSVTRLEPPVVALPVIGWNRATAKALRFALRLTPDVVVMHVSTSDEEAAEFCREWRENVEEPLRRIDRQPPATAVLPSPYRHLVKPLLDHVQRLERDYPNRQIAVVIPELVGARWWQYVIHNQRSSLLKAALLVWGDRHVVVINVPWYVTEEQENEPRGSSPLQARARD